MKAILLTIAIILTIILISNLSVLAQSARPGQPIKGVIVKGGQNPTSLASEMPGQPIGGIVVKGGFTAENAINNPLFEQSGNAGDNPMFESKVSSDMAAAGTTTNPYYMDNRNIGEIKAFVAGSPIGGIVVRGAKPTKMEVNPLYKASGAQGSNPLYKGDK